jgi:hypothetical protein
MSPSSTREIYQVGTQAVHGTGVAATAKLAVPRIDFEPTDNVNRPRLAHGLMVRAPGNEFVQARGTTWRVPAHPLNYEQLQGWLNAAIAGGVTGQSGNGAPYAWDFVRNPAAYPALELLTLERRMTNLTDHIDERWLNAVITRLTISGQRNGEVQLAIEGFAGRRNTNALTAALTMPAVEHVPFPLSTVFINNAWNDLGDTRIAGQVLSWSWSFMTGAVGLPTAEGNVNLDYDTLVINSDMVGTEFRATLLQDKTRYEAERAAAEAQSLRAIRIAMAGTGNRALTIDSLLKYESGSIQAVAESDGQVVYDAVLRDATDAANLADVALVNNTDNKWGIAA